MNILLFRHLVVSSKEKGMELKTLYLTRQHFNDFALDLKKEYWREMDTIPQEFYLGDILVKPSEYCNAVHEDYILEYA